ncbi:dextranase 1 [Lactobacillus phage phiPYB5]|uniref:endolysin n=1 Tax=Lactobacillus phage phiPYB5 TaxID=438780 RepID=UPI0001C0AD88|nr:endolysin [Lactobacillus phage phiPYB5]ADA79896.1 dextranase 1 [Lactobacillus phage phiPYB5]
MTTANVIDISEFQDPTKFDYQAAKSNGIKAVIIRLSVGNRRDNHAAEHIANCEKYGLKWHGYHYWYNLSGEATFAVSDAQSLGLTPSQYFFLDMEDSTLSSDWSAQFESFRSAIGDKYKIGLYCSDSPYKSHFDNAKMVAEGVYRWIAAYSYEPANYDIWQMSGEGSGGFGSYTGDIDRDYDKTGNLILEESQPITPSTTPLYRQIIGEAGYDTDSGIYGMGRSYDNGKTFHVMDTVYGRIYRQQDGDSIWPFLKQKISTINGDVGQIPQITSNGHWQIGNNVTNYSVGMLDTDDSTTLIDLSTNKALYNPSEKVIFHVTSVSGHGHLDVHYYHLNELVAEKQIYYGTSEISWSWFLPADDNVGYSVVIDNYVGSNVGYNNKIAINVCSNVYQFPIMGFLSSYAVDSSTDRKQTLDYMKRLHINLVQMYDWFDLHSLPLPVSANGDSTQVSNTWTDIGNRLTRKKVIEDYCNLIKDYGMKPLAYMAMNGSDTNQLVHGLSAEMFLYNDNSKSLDSVYKTLDKNNGWGKYSLWNTNWMNGPWQDYIVNQMQIVRDNMPFDGWHIDMFGDPGNKYDSNGNELSSSLLAGGIHYFLDKAQ